MSRWLWIWSRGQNCARYRTVVLNHKRQSCNWSYKAHKFTFMHNCEMFDKTDKKQKEKKNNWYYKTDHNISLYNLSQQGIFTKQNVLNLILLSPLKSIYFCLWVGNKESLASSLKSLGIYCSTTFAFNIH